MEEDNKKKKKIIGISLGVVGALLLLFSGTYAYWQLTKEQSSANEIVAACLDFELSDVTEAISLERAYPISETESEELTGYTFKVKNNCNDSIDYMIGLNSITNNSENYLANTSLRVKLDNNTSTLYSSLNDIEYVENVRYSKELGTSTIQGNSENTHLLKVWVDENAPVTEQGKTFTGKIIITGSVGRTPTSSEGEEQIAENCFMVTNDGIVLGYDYACGTDVVVPAEVDGIQIKKIANGSFKGDITGIIAQKDCTTNNGKLECNYYSMIVLIKDNENITQIINNLKNQMCANPSTCTIQELETDWAQAIDLNELKIVSSMEEYNNYFANFESIYYTEAGDSADLDSNPYSMLATTLDLSAAIYLENINEFAFRGGDSQLTSVKFPENGMLTTIERKAFADNQLTKIVVPSSVTTIENNAFENNPLTEVIIKRANADGMNIETDAFPTGITPTYNPNYTE